MEIKEVTYHVKLVADFEDGEGYKSYVFERFDYNELDSKYLMCVQFPNWNQGLIKIGDVGYVSVKYVEAGIDKWYDGNNFIPYKKTDIIFLKFIHEKLQVKNDEIFLD